MEKRDKINIKDKNIMDCLFLNTENNSYIPNQNVHKLFFVVAPLQKKNKKNGIFLGRFIFWDFFTIQLRYDYVRLTTHKLRPINE